MMLMMMKSSHWLIGSACTISLKEGFSAIPRTACRLSTQVIWERPFTTARRVIGLQRITNVKSPTVQAYVVGNKRKTPIRPNAFLRCLLSLYTSKPLNRRLRITQFSLKSKTLVRSHTTTINQSRRSSQVGLAVNPCKVSHPLATLLAIMPNGVRRGWTDFLGPGPRP